jgi:4-hydroxy-3-polyprenylbenzoate decarboxylase
MGELRREGPFGDHTGFYSLEDDFPVFHLTCITQRKKPVYATTVVGPPPMEDFYMGQAIERIFLPLMRLQLPEIRDISMPAEGVFHNLMLVAMRKSYPGHARKVMHAIWGMGQAMFSTRSATFSSSWDRWIRSTTPAACRTTARRWAWTPRASGRRRASPGPGPT